MAHSLFSFNPLSPLHFPSSSSSSAPDPPPRRVTLPCRVIGISSAFHLQRVLAAKALQTPEAPINVDAPEEEDKKPVTSKSIPFLPNFNLFNIPAWMRWILTPMILVAIPYYKKISTIEDKAEKVAQSVLETIESAAEVTEKFSKELAATLPENGKLKEIILEVEDIAKMVDKGAETAESLLKKVDDVVEEVDEVVEDLEEMVKLPIGKVSKKVAYVGSKQTNPKRD